MAKFKSLKKFQISHENQITYKKLDKIWSFKHLGLLPISDLFIINICLILFIFDIVNNR